MITNGTVRYLKRVKTADYEHHEAEATMSYTIDDYKQTAVIVAQVEKVAVQQVYRILTGRSDERPLSPDGTIQESIAANPTLPMPTPEPSSQPMQPVRRRRGRGSVEQPASGANGKSDVCNAEDHKGLGDTLLGQTQDPVLPDEAVSNDQLREHVNTAAKRLGDPNPVRKLIEQFAGPVPKTAYDIPLQVRPAFVRRLGQLGTTESTNLL